MSIDGSDLITGDFTCTTGSLFCGFGGFEALDELGMNTETCEDGCFEPDEGVFCFAEGLLDGGVGAEGCSTLIAFFGLSVWAFVGQYCF
jgi:hypothetical protein